MTDPYASVAEVYDLMVDWPARLARERPFFETLLRETGARRVLDVGCATGHHSRLFAELGATVTGLDPSVPMLARARALTTGENPRFEEGGFAEIPMLADTFDLIIVLGNTLAHAHDLPGVTRALKAMRAALAPGGCLLIQVINYDSLRNAGSRWLPLSSRQWEGRDYVFLREHRLLGRRAEFTLITLARGDDWQQRVERSVHVPLTGDILRRALSRAGFAQCNFYGSYRREPYAPAASPNLVVLASRE